MSVHLFDPVKKRNNKLKMDTFAPHYGKPSFNLSQERGLLTI